MNSQGHEAKQQIDGLFLKEWDLMGAMYNLHPIHSGKGTKNSTQTLNPLPVFQNLYALTRTHDKA